MKRLTTFLLALMLTWIGANAQIVSGTDYLIVDAEGNYLGGGQDYGTHATTIGKPQFINFEAQSVENVYHLDSHQYNSSTAHYLGANLYFDNATPVDWTVTQVDGGYTIYGTVSDGTGYLTSNGFQELATVETEPYVWTLVTKDEVIASMSEATADAPVDVTALIKAPELKHNSNTTYYQTWTVTGYDGTGTPSNYAFGGGNAIASCAESYHSTNGFNINQEITLPSAGYYTLSAKGFYRDDSSTTLLLPVLYAGDQTSTFPEITRTDAYLGVADNMANAYQEFLLGLHQIDAITFSASNANETITIGLKGEDTTLWQIFGELELLYYGTEEPVLPVHECMAEIDDWSTTGNNGTFVVNTWSTEDDASGMKIPFCQNWVYGNTLTAATISHETLTDLEPGHYTVSMDIRIFNESGTAIGTGTMFNANGVSEDLATGSDANPDVYGTETEVYGTYTLNCTVYDDGQLDISIVIPDNVTYNWIAWKNLSVTYSGPITEPAIGYATASATMVQPGEEVSVTFKKVAPEEGSYTLSGSGFTDRESNISVTYSSDGVFTFTVPDDASDSFSVTIPAGQLTYIDNGSTVASSEEQTIGFTVPVIANQYGVYLLNCHIDEFISRGYTWGTEADADHYGIPVDIIANEDGLYTIDFVDGSGYLGFTGWAYTDCSGADIMHYTIEPYSDGTLTGYRFRCEEASTDDVACYLYVNESGDFLIANNGHEGYLGDDPQNYTDVSQTVWQILSMDERDEHKAAFVESQKVAIAELVNATDLDTYISSQTANDVTFFVSHPDFSSVSTTAGTSGWVSSGTNDSGNNKSASASNNGIEVYDGCQQIQQSITGLDKGVYKIDLNGFFRQATNTICWPYKDYDLSIAYIDANGYEINLASWGSEATLSGTTYSPDTKAEAYTACADGYANELYTYVGEDGELVITIVVPGYEYHEWMYLREMTLTYYGELDIEDDCDYADGEEVTVDGTIYTVKGENMFVNGGFNYGVDGWTAGNTYTDPLASGAVTFSRTGGYNGGTYVTLPSSVGAGNAATPTQAIAVEAGKTYLFVGYTSGTTPDKGNLRYSALFEADLNDDGEIVEKHHTEVEDNEEKSYSNTIIQLEWDNGDDEYNGWTQTIGVFTVPATSEEGTYSYVGMRMNWSEGSYDGFQLYEVEATGVEWEMTEAGWGTMILPFAADVPDGLTLYAGSALSIDDSTITVSDEDATTTIVANTPYLVKGTEGTYTFTGTAVEAESLTSGMLTGTYETLDCDALLEAAGTNTVYLLQDQGEGATFYPVVEEESADATLTPYHCYLTISSDVSPTALHLPGMSTGIKAVESDLIANDAIYDLSGRRVSKAVKGVYIQNGKKVLVK